MTPGELSAAGRILLRLIETPGPLETPCWIWPGAHTEGYGRISVGPRSGVQTARVHRLIYRLLVGELPDDRPQLDHLCRIHACANPAHLEPVTNRENQLRGEGFVAIRARQKACIHGHRFTKANTIIRANGTRRCRKCRTIRDAARDRRKQLAA